MRHHLGTTGLLLAALSIAGCGADSPAPGPASDDEGAPRYEGNFTVLEDASHGPQLCVNVALSLPPQCGGPDIVGWDWDAVDGEETVNQVTWGDYHVTGSYVDGVFTLTAPADPPVSAGVTPVPALPPACDDPEVVDPTQGAGPAMHDRIRQTYGGALCVVEREAATAGELARITQEVMDADSVAHLDVPVSAGPDVQLGAVRVEVWVADQPALDYARQRWGDLVVLEGVLRPVS